MVQETYSFLFFYKKGLLCVLDIGVMFVKKPFEFIKKMLSDVTKKEETLLDTKRELTYQEKDIILYDYKDVITPKTVLHTLEKVQNQTSDHYYTYHRDFVLDSLRFAKEPGEEDVKYISFMQYYPTFFSLSNQQKKWYFHWREKVVNGNYVKTDTSYVFLFIYELINYTFNQKASVNISLMVHLYENYREDHLEIQRYLTEWIGHMLLEAGEKEKAAKWIGNTSNNYLYDKASKAMKENKDWSRISITLWKNFLTKTSDTAFYTQHKNKIYKVFKYGIEQYRVYCEQHGIVIKEAWFEESRKSVDLMLFSRANVYRDSSAMEYTMTTIGPSKLMYEQITAMLKHAENIVRKAEGTTKLVKVPEEVLPDDFLALMETVQLSRFTKVQSKSTVEGSVIPSPPNSTSPNFAEGGAPNSRLEEPSPSVELEFDDEEIQAARQESKELQKIFELYESNLDGENKNRDANQVDTSSYAGIQKADEERRGNPLLSETGLESKSGSEVIEPSLAFFFSLNDKEVLLIHQFTGIFLPMNKGAQFGIDNGTPIEKLIEGINLVFRKYFGSSFIEEFRGNYRINEEYLSVYEDIKHDRFKGIQRPETIVDENRGALGQEVSLPPATSTREEDVKVTEKDLPILLQSGTGENKEEYVESLNDNERFLLFSFEDMELSVSDAKKLMKSKGAMINTVISSINEKAVEHLGDNLLEQDGDVYVVFEEFAEVLEKVKGSV